MSMTIFPTALHHRLHTLARQAPDAPALACFAPNAARLTRGQLDAQAARLAAVLRAHGVRGETRVGVCIERSCDLFVAMLAVLKAGGAFVPLDPRLPAARIEWMARDAGLSICMVSANAGGSVHVPGVATIVDVGRALDPEHEPERGDARDEGEEQTPAHPRAAAYLVYTSGSTGTPKAVVVEHGPLAAHCEAVIEAYPMRATDRVLHFASIGFDLAHEYWLAPLAAGASIVVTESGPVSPQSVRALMARERVSVAAFPPAYLQAFADVCAREGAPSDLRIVAFGGEAMAGDRFERVRATFPGVRLINGYGPTETVVSPMLWPVDADARIDTSGAAALPIGQPIGPRSARLAAGDAREGGDGELLLGGACLARGYHGRPALTAERFIPDERGRPGARVYRTGDRARLREDGAFDYLGRLDDQVQLRGMRVEPGEIEQALRRHPEVREAAVLADTSAGQVRLIAFVAAPAAVTEARLREHVARSVPDAWIPARTIVVEALPRALSGKVDRQALFALAASRTPAAAYRAPLDPTPCELARIWHAILGGEPMGLDDRFFPRGGDSIGVMQLQSAIEDRWAVRLPLAELFEDRSLEQLAALVDSSPGVSRSHRAAREPERESARAADGGAAYVDHPASFAQRRFWALARIGGVRDAYHIAAHWDIDGRIDPAVLSRALSAVIERHDAWRTAFVEDEDGALVQRVYRRVEAPIERIDLSRIVDPHEQALRGEDLAAQWAATPFDLSRAPLLRAALVTFADDRHRLMLTLHHAIGDGWSSRVAFGELARAYTAIIQGAPLEWPALPLQYADYARRQRHWLGGGARARQLDYWRGALADLPAPLALPVDRQPPSERTLEGGRTSRRLDPAVSQALRALARDARGSTFMVVLSALHAWLYRLTGAADVIVAAPVTTRRQGELASLVGLFVNTVALRARIAPLTAFSSLLAQVRETTLEAYEHSDVSFDEVVDAIELPVRRGADWLRVKFAQQFVFGEPVAVPGALARLTPGPDSAARFDFAIDFTDDPHGVELVAAWAADCIDTATARGWLDSFAALVEHAVREPACAIASLACHDGAHAALHPGPSRAFAFTDVLEAFAHQAAAAPHRIAVSDALRALTFAELDTASTAVASALRRSGTGRECAVALGIERSVEFVVAMLGVMKAGAAVVPLDPAAPLARAAASLTACSARCLIVAEPAPSWAAALSIETVQLDELLAQGGRGGAGDGFDHAVAHPGQAAYVIFTSGSTGAPKGVLVSHGALGDYVQGMLEALAFAPNASMAMASTVAADLGHTTLFGALCSGRTLHLPSAACAFDPDRFAQVMREHGVGILKIVPSHLRALLEAQDAADVLPSHALILGGEPLPYALAARIRALRPACRIINHYGPTEATVGALALELRVQAPVPAGAFAPTGRPLPNVRARVLDALGSPAPMGAYGELYLGGPGLARGYVGLPAATAERFVPDPYGPPGSRLYRTGDRVRVYADGVLQWAGRLDDQIKIRGYRVEPGEVSAALAAIDCVAQAETLAVRDERGVRLVSFAVLATAASTGEQTGATLRATLAERLPDYMVPARILVRESLPITANGKVDRASLRALAETAGESREPGPTVRLEGVEGLLAEVWQAVLRVERVSRDENFFALGGDSIIALQVIARSRKAGVRFTPKQLFDRPTIAQLAQVAQVAAYEPARASVADDRGPEPGRSEGEALALTPAQHRFFALGVPHPHHWNQAVELEPHGVFDFDAFAQALGAVLSRHDVFRLRFEPVHERPSAGRWRMYYSERAFDVLPLAVVDVRGGDEALARFDALQRDIDLARGPLVRALVAHLPSGRARVFVAIHHLIVDGVSWRLLLEDLHSAYEAARMHAPVRLPSASASTPTAPAWATRLARATTSSFAQELPFWLALRDAVASRPKGMSHAQANADDVVGQAVATNATARTLVRSLDPQLTGALLTDANVAWRTQTQDLLLAALVHALTEDGACESCLVELEGHGREALFDDVDASRTLGWLTSRYPMALPVGPTLIDTVVRVKEAMRAVPNRGLGFGVLRYLGDEATRSQLSLLPKPLVTFNYLGRFEPVRGEGFGVRFGGVGCERDPAGPMANALAVHAFVDETRVLHVHWVYGAATIEADALERIARRFEAALSTLAACCGERVAAHGGGATPSDFPLAREAGLTQATIDAAGLDWRRIDDVYPLSPMQQGILFESLLAPEQATYVNQLVATLDAPDIERLSAAFERTVGEHDVLRTSFLAEANPPLQAVHRRAALPIAILDWREAPEADFERWLVADRARGFSLSAPPLMRLTLIRLNERIWRLVWTRHHLLLDGWSTARLFADVLREYAQGPRTSAFRSGRGVRYRDFIAWLAERDEASDRAFWLARLARLDGPTLIAQPSSQAAAEPAQWRAALDAAATAALAACAKRLHVTVNTIVQGAWALTLQRMTNQRAVAFGATVAGRPDALADIDSVVGLLINTLPVIAAPSPSQRVSQWLTALQHENAACVEHAHTPLFDVQRWAGQTGGALFDTLIVFENYPVDEAWSAADERALRFAEVRSIDATDFAVTLVVQAGERLTIDYGFDGARISERRVQGLHRAFARCLDAFVADPSALLGSLSIETAPGRAEVARWNATGHVWAERQSAPLHRQFERQVAVAPNAPALLWRETQADTDAGADATADAPMRRVTYAELDARANRVASALRALGAKRDAPIALCLERSIEMVVALLGVMKAGAAWLPIDPDYPAQRIAYMFDDAQPLCVVTQRALFERVRAAVPLEAGIAVSCVEALESSGAESMEAPTSPTATVIAPEQLAYLIYTSGSTGKPKGAGNTHGALANRIAWMQDAFELTRDDIVLQKTPFGFDVSVWEFLWPLSVGATLALSAPGDHREPARLVQAIEAYGVTTLHFVPSMLAAFLGYVESFGESGRCASVVRIVASGEALRAELVGKTAALMPQASLHNLYGPTEAAIDVSHWPCTPGEDPAGAGVPIGRPIANVQLHVFDAAWQPLPVGAVGELYLGGVGLARGYHRRPSLTAERFVPDPFVAGGRLYRTGDLVIRRGDGALEYLGRVDQQLKLRGLRIEPGEIEALLRAEPGVDDAVAIVREGQLLAYVARGAGIQLDQDGIYARLNAQLPAFMVPTRVIELEALPLTPNGKCDRAALPSPTAVGPTAGETEDTAPATETQRKVAEIWARVLPVERIGRGDDFFLLGGHSLLAAAAHAQTNRQWELTLPLRSLFAARTLERYAAGIDEALAARAAQGQGGAAEAIGALLDELEAT